MTLTTGTEAATLTTRLTGQPGPHDPAHSVQVVFVLGSLC